MKKFIVLLLAALMIVGLCVSCKENLPVAPEEIVEDVVEGTIDTFGLFGEPVYALASGHYTPEETKTHLDPYLKNNLEYYWECDDVTVESVITENSIYADILGDSNVNELKVETSNLEYHDDPKYSVSGSFTIYAKGREEGASVSFDVKGTFEISTYVPGTSSITFTSVKYRGTEYDLAAFNEAMKEALKDWPSVT